MVGGGDVLLTYTSRKGKDICVGGGLFIRCRRGRVP